MQSYGFTALRCFIDASFWVNNPTVQTDSGTLSFRQVLDDFLTRCGNHGLYVVLVGSHVNQIQVSYPYGSMAKGQTLFNQQTFRDYVVDQVRVLGGHNNLVIEPWNEPISGWLGEGVADLALWQNDWQAIINGVRAIEEELGYVSHLVIAGFFTSLCSWTTTEEFANFNYVNNYPLFDPDGNLVYTIHCYRLDDFGNPGGSMGTIPPYPDITSLPHTYEAIKAIFQQERLDTFSASHPVFIGEIGANVYRDASNDSDFLKNALQIFNEWGISYTGWWWRNEAIGAYQLVVAETEATSGGTLNLNGEVLSDAIKSATPPLPIVVAPIELDISEEVKVNIGFLLILLMLCTILLLVGFGISRKRGFK